MKHEMIGAMNFDLTWCSVKEVVIGENSSVLRRNGQNVLRNYVTQSKVDHFVMNSCHLILRSPYHTVGWPVAKEQFSDFVGTSAVFPS
jgi:hypothetical protein